MQHTAGSCRLDAVATLARALKVNTLRVLVSGLGIHRTQSNPRLECHTKKQLNTCNNT